jgi:hypothetical protein
MQLVHNGAYADMSKARMAICEGFSLSCRRLREVELRMACLWSDIDNDMPPERIAIQLERSRGAPSTFYIDYRSYGLARAIHCKCASFKCIMGNGARMSGGTILLGRTPNRRVNVAHDCLVEAQKERSSFPSLKALYVSDMGFSRSVSESLKHWSLPHLEDLLCSTSVLPYLPLTKPLSTLKVVSNYNRGYFSSVQGFLESPIVFELRILGIWLTLLHTPTSLAPPQEISLPTVKDLSLCIMATEEALTGVMPLFECLKVANVETVTLNLVYPVLQHGTFLSWWKELVRAKSLRKVSVRCRTDARFNVPPVNVQRSIISQLLAARDGTSDDGKPEIEIV